MTRRSRITRALGLVAWALALGPGCGPLPWGEQGEPLVAVPPVAAGEPVCDGALDLVRWDHERERGVIVAPRLWRGDCVRGFDQATWQDLYLACRDTGRAGRLGPALELGARGAARRSSCARIVTAAAP